jgi:hypothetical protein
MNRIAREKKTVKAMITLYCGAQHQRSSVDLCPQCSELLDYAWRRVDKCPFADKKPTCAKCTVHCYKPSMRQAIVEVMRYSGPRMIRKHPLLALAHIVDGLKNPKKHRLNE